MVLADSIKKNNDMCKRLCFKITVGGAFLKSRKKKGKRGDREKKKENKPVWGKPTALKPIFIKQKTVKFKGPTFLPH